MSTLTIDRATVDSLTAKLDGFADQLTDDEHSHLLALLALATSQVVEANDVTIDEPEVAGFAAAGCGFGSVMNPLGVTGDDGGCIPDPFGRGKGKTIFYPRPPIDSTSGNTGNY